MHKWRYKTRGGGGGGGNRTHAVVLAQVLPVLTPGDLLYPDILLAQI